jgi:hypothetical protein
MDENGASYHFERMLKPHNANTSHAIFMAKIRDLANGPTIRSRLRSWTDGLLEGVNMGEVMRFEVVPDDFDVVELEGLIWGRGTKVHFMRTGNGAFAGSGGFHAVQFGKVKIADSPARACAAWRSRRVCRAGCRAMPGIAG